jgi:hypothetical protein
MRLPLDRLLCRLLVLAVLAKPSDPFMSRSGREPYSHDWVYVCRECHEEKCFPDKQPSRPVCHSKLMELIRSPEGER